MDGEKAEAFAAAIGQVSEYLTVIGLGRNPIDVMRDNPEGRAALTSCMNGFATISANLHELPVGVEEAARIVAAIRSAINGSSGTDFQKAVDLIFAMRARLPRQRGQENVLDSPPPTVAVFRSERERRHLQFGDELARDVQNTKWMGVIQHLLVNPGQQFSGTDLDGSRGSTSGQDDRDLEFRLVSEELAKAKAIKEKSGFHSPRWEKTIAELEAKKKALSHRGLGRRARTNPEETSTDNRVRTGIRRALGTIRKKSGRMHEHLAGSLTLTKDNFAYRPIHPVQWLTSV